VSSEFTGGRSSRRAVPPFLKRESAFTQRRFRSLFATQIANEHTGAAYYGAINRFFSWAITRVDSLNEISAASVSEYVGDLAKTHSAQTVNQHVAALSKLFRYLAESGAVSGNPISSIRRVARTTPRTVRPVATVQQARMLLDSIDAETTAGLRDRAILALMVYAFLSVSEVVALDCRSYRRARKQSWLDVGEGANARTIPVHSALRRILDAYVSAADVNHERSGPLIRSLRRRSDRLSERRISRVDVLRITKRRSRAANLSEDVSCRMLRGVGIRVFLNNGGAFSAVKQMAGLRSMDAVETYAATPSIVTVADLERIAV